MAMPGVEPWGLNTPRAIPWCMRAWAPHQKDAQTEHQPRPRWLDDGTHADASKAEAAPTSKLKLKSSKLKLGLSHVLLACLGKTAFLKELLFQQSWEMGSKKWLSATTVALTSMSFVDSLRNKSNTDNSAVNVICVRAKKSLLIT